MSIFLVVWVVSAFFFPNKDPGPEGVRESLTNTLCKLMICQNLAGSFAYCISFNPELDSSVLRFTDKEIKPQNVK